MMKNFNTLIFLGFTEKIRVLGRVTKNQYIEGRGLTKKGGLDNLQI